MFMDSLVNMSDWIIAATVVGSVVLVLLAAGVYIASNLLYICEPNEILVFSGAGRKGYTTVKGGRRLRVPLLMKVDRLDMTNMIIEVSVSQAYSKGGIPLTVQGVANLKIAGHDQKLENAIERLLGKPREEVIRIAKDVLEGNLRGVLAKLTPEQVNEDKLLFAEQLLDEAEHDLSRLGLVLDTMKIQNVFDERGYLDSIGRRKSAEIIKKSRIAEARNKAEAMVRDATNREAARLAELENEEQTARARADRRIADARTNATARIAEEAGRVNALIARAEAALEAEEARVELLGKPREEVIRIAKDVLEGNLRGVLAKLTPEQVNEDKLLFAEQLLDEAEHDLSRLGLVLDTMKIQNVFDERGYLDSIGRRKSAEIIKKSRIAEARNKAEAMVRDATNREAARLAELENEEQTARARADRRIADARTNATARIAEEAGRVNALIARAEAALEAEEARVEQVRLQLEADVIEPARAQMEAGISEARGRSARILEEGRATVKVLQEMIRVWKVAGPNARDIFLMQKLHTIMESLVETIGEVEIDRLTMLPGTSTGTAAKTVQLVEELKAAVGVDLPQLLEGIAGGRSPLVITRPRS